ncbi:hypothetical protein DOM21_10680 [Bacteriovorax stolpii]|uniref:Uncharacterized protein n=1 Tax=Bacteriovorax stolpii TaxID=960 RepID=A0A2K9NRI1_BACTC|nr:hypothetical protein [Bacteriovorax stolpii]AUN98117.1 hypothetical protein C0V70_08345 [Bacteriovorax stolpii]QDK41903.1 hypothetical protein DOM21_10680 [Bacteriovorax stolpii]TDP52030.1 hypothetical protein C8D79_2678 [Bacteriovorax stolpii]
MDYLKTHLKKFGGITILVMVLTLFLQGCIQSPQSKRNSLKSASTTDSSGTTKLPEFTAGNNFIQNGASVYLSSVPLSLNFSDYIQLRGKDVDSYIRSTGTSNIVCLTSRYTQAAVNKVILMAAIPRSVYNFTSQTLEYYYNISPSDVTSNQSFCQKTGVINKLYSLYPALTPKYQISEICPTGTCSSSSYPGQSLELYSTTGTPLTQIATKHLLFTVSNSTSGNSSSGQTCTDSSQCTSQGYDCCSSGQCVKDLAQRPGVDTSSNEYLQALQDILNNPSNVYLYPQYYFICSQPVTTPTTPTTPTDPVNEANVRLKKMANLYNCTTKIEGEYGLCTKTYTNATIGQFYSAGKDDRSFADTFTHINVDKQTLVSIEEISYGEVVIYDYTTKTDTQLLPNIYEDTAVRIEGSHNDDLATGAAIQVKVKPSAAVSNDLVIKYKIDASCTQVNASLAKCEKYYIQGQDDAGDTIAAHRRGRVTDHYPDSNIFKLPYYANTAKAITVEVDGITQKQDLDWQLNIGAPSTIQFLPVNTLKVFKDQKVRISYFVDLTVNNVMESKLAALNEIKTICSCSGTNCSLTPVKNTAGAITDYACVYPDPDPVDPPMSQKIYLSSKTVPVRFYDSNGAAQTTVNASTLKQEGTEFKYRNDNLLNPSNMPDITNAADTSDTYTGFNEIYGSLSYTNGSAKPAYEVSVKKGTTYDIYVDRGSFSNCVQCGNDYYSQLNKLFPLAQFGGGSVPLLGQTNRSMSNGIRSDEMKFGRACLVPATMIPWTHGTESTAQVQRMNRMRAQHFMFANGYQYDWYGFDYGSVIGSFDGVKWFSIGTNRRIKAESNKMFVAVNGLFGDLTLEATYEVTINDGTLNPLGSNMVTTDYNSDGAQCQQFHQCSTDNDCATTLGWEYSCASVNEITTSWPKFDDNAKEIPETNFDNNRFTSILGISTTGKRCVYRGRGALCTQNYNNVNVNSTFNQSTSQQMHSCSSNTYCQSISVNGVPAAKFNNRIARYGKVRTDSTVDSFGLAALIPGRPYSFNGVETVRAETLKNLNVNKAMAMCIPGRDVDQTSFLEQNRVAPTGTEFTGDKVLGIGMSYRKSTPTAAPNYLNACSIMDSTKNFYHNTTTQAGALFSNASVYPNLKYDAGSQAMSTNVLGIFDSIFSSKGISFGLYKSTSAILTTTSFQENRCLRAPGSSCFTDMDCGPSKVVSDKIKSLSAADSVVTNILNKYEVMFWQEELVCSQAQAKTSSLYDPKNNRCCREVGKTISLPSGDNVNLINYNQVPGLDTSIGYKYRYSRAATMYKESNTDAGNFPALSVASKDQCGSPADPLLCKSTATLANQFRTFTSLAEKTSCSGDWVRSFATSGTKWESSRFQAFAPSMFKCFNWYGGTGGYTCSQYEADDPACPMAQTQPSTPKAKEILSYLGRLELMGIPQISFPSEEYYSDATEERGMSCKSHPSGRSNTYPNNASSTGGTYLPPSTLYKSGAIKEYVDSNTAPTMYSYSAVDNTNFQSMKQIFKSDEVRGCLPAGTQMTTGADPALCCTGMINSKTLKCQLDDYVDVSVYTNRYVSSEAKKLNITLFDSNGYIKDPAYAANLACERQMCASGKLAYGILISRLKTPGQESLPNKYFRFLEGNTADNINKLLDIYNKGLKLNNHVYCIPETLDNSATQSDSDDLTIFTCGN